MLDVERHCYHAIPTTYICVGKVMKEKMNLPVCRGHEPGRRGNTGRNPFYVERIHFGNEIPRDQQAT